MARFCFGDVVFTCVVFTCIVFICIVFTCQVDKLFSVNLLRCMHGSQNTSHYRSASVHSNVHAGWEAGAAVAIVHAES